MVGGSDRTAVIVDIVERCCSLCRQCDHSHYFEVASGAARRAAVTAVTAAAGGLESRCWLESSHWTRLYFEEGGREYHEVSCFNSQLAC